MKIINIPIENIKERYSEKWNKWFPNEFKKLNINYLTIMPDQLNNTITKGSFLDVYGTNYFKAAQLQQIIKLIYNNIIIDDDILFFHDLWFPGLEMLQYIRQGADKKFKICGILHAGTYDHFDFLFKKGMSYWGKNLENVWFSFIDKIFVATEFHKKLILKNRKVSEKKIIVTGLPIFDTSLQTIKKNIIVFPHRKDSEKCPQLFEKLKKSIVKSNWEFIYTKDYSYDQYYKILNEGKISVSFSKQETWGIAMQESVFAECIPVVPDRLSYQEMYFERFKYSSFEECVKYINKMITDESFYLENKKETIKLKNIFLEKGSLAIKNIIDQIKN
jgi:hypothetical protein